MGAQEDIPEKEDQDVKMTCIWLAVLRLLWGVTHSGSSRTRVSRAPGSTVGLSSV